MAELTLKTGGAVYSGWTEIRVTRSIKRGASDFDIALTDRWPGRTAPWPIRPGADCIVALDGETVLTGYTDSRSPSFEATAHAVRAAGRSKTMDLVDCSAIVKGGQFRNYTLPAIARALAKPFGIGVTVLGDAGAAFSEVQIEPGETCFDVIERLCRLRGLLVCDAAGGNIVIARPGSFGARNAPLVESRQGANGSPIGGNLKSGRSVESFSGRYSDYIVRGQQAGTDYLSGSQASQPQGVARDDAVSRYRPRLIVAEAPGGGGDFQTRADWDAQHAAGLSLSASLTVAGWSDSAGALWTPGAVVHVDSPTLGIDRELVIVTASYKRSAKDGTETELEVQPENALTPQPVNAVSGGAAGSVDQWSNVV